MFDKIKNYVGENMSNIKQAIIFGVFGVVVVVGAYFVSRQPNNPVPVPPVPTPVNPETPYVVGAEDLIPIGNIVILKVVPFQKKPAGFLTYAIAWKILEDGKEITPPNLGYDGDEMYFGTGSTKRQLLVICSVTHVLENNVAKNYLMLVKVTIGEMPIPPPPVPPVPPTPPEPIPDGKFKLAKFSFDVGAKVVSPNKTSEVKGLVGSFRGMAAAVNAGTITDLKDLLLKTRDSNNAALAVITLESIQRWEVFSAELQDRLYTLYSERKINTARDMAVAFNEIADGLQLLVR